MNNPGMDLEIWKDLKSKWTELDAKGHKLKIDFQLIAHPNDAKRILAIDVIQHIDGKPVTETVERTAGEGYEPMGIAGLSRQALEQVYRQMLQGLRERSTLREVDVVVSLSVTSPTSGELQGYLEVPNAPVQTCLAINYQHYYVLRALGERMLEEAGKPWKSVRAVYHEGELAFDFKYV